MLPRFPVEWKLQYFADLEKQVVAGAKCTDTNTVKY